MTYQISDHRSGKALPSDNSTAMAFDEHADTLGCQCIRTLAYHILLTQHEVFGVQEHIRDLSPYVRDLHKYHGSSFITSSQARLSAKKPAKTPRRRQCRSPPCCVFTETPSGSRPLCPLETRGNGHDSHSQQQIGDCASALGALQELQVLDGLHSFLWIFQCFFWQTDEQYFRSLHLAHSRSALPPSPCEAEHSAQTPGL